MIGIEWNRPASLTTSVGTLVFNSFPGLMLDASKCKATKQVRVTKDPVPNGDGDIIHRRFLTGYTYKIAAEAWLTEQIEACDEDGRLMLEELALHLHAMLNDPGRYCWTPSDYGDNRALDEARWAAQVDESFANGLWQVEFQIDSPFPYAIDLTQQAITAAASTIQPITNAGNTVFYPVIQIQGPATDWTVSNTTTGDGIVYDSSRPGAPDLGGGDYAEIDTFKSTIFLNGDGADMSAGFDPTVSDFLTLIPGVNDIVAIDADAVFLVNNSWG